MSMLYQFEAATFLGVSPAELDKYVTAGRLHIYNVGILPLYDQDELIRLKAELDAKSRQKATQPPATDLKSFVETAEAFYRLTRHFFPSADEYKGAFTVKGASSFSGISESTLRRDINASKLKARPIDGVLRIKRQDFYAYLKREWPK